MMMVEHSLVTAAKQNDGNIGLRAAVSLGYFPLGHCATQSSDLCDFILGQELFELCDPSDIDGVLLVPAVINPLQIRGDAIHLNAVDVVDHGQVVGIGDKCERDESMDGNGFSLPVFVQSHLGIARAASARSQDFSITKSGASTIGQGNSTDASYSAESTDFVEISEIGDGSPFFINNDIHTAGCPSGDSRSTIKDPPHASSFGGSAIMASASANYKRSHLDAG